MLLIKRYRTTRHLKLNLYNYKKYLLYIFYKKHPDSYIFFVKFTYGKNKLLFKLYFFNPSNLPKSERYDIQNLFYHTKTLIPKRGMYAEFSHKISIFVIYA